MKKVVYLLCGLLCDSVVWDAQARALQAVSQVRSRRCALIFRADITTRIDGGPAALEGVRKSDTHHRSIGIAQTVLNARAVGVTQLCVLPEHADLIARVQVTLPLPENSVRIPVRIVVDIKIFFV